MSTEEWRELHSSTISEISIVGVTLPWDVQSAVWLDRMRRKHGDWSFLEQYDLHRMNPSHLTNMVRCLKDLTKEEIEQWSNHKLSEAEALAIIGMRNRAKKNPVKDAKRRSLF
jgi:hypothetical protein